MKSKKSPRKKPRFPRKTWSRSPVQKPHSSARGGKGYDRRQDQELHRELED